MDNNQGMEEKRYALSGKIMVSAIAVLFFVIVLMVALHIYARWYLIRARRRQNRIRRMQQQQQRRVHTVFYNDLIDIDGQNSTGLGLASEAARGLDASMLKSLPGFVYSSKTHSEPIDCAVCLSEFEENETGRILPKCNHSFHMDCIDMWFHSHSTCPLCRSTVEFTDSQLETFIDVDKPETNEPGSSSGFYSECQCETARAEDNSAAAAAAAASSSSSIGDSIKAPAFVGISIEVPRRNWSIGSSVDEPYRSDSPTIQRSFRSPVSRMFSFKRMLSRERIGNISSGSPSSANWMGCSSVSESDAGPAARVETL